MTFARVKNRPTPAQRRYLQLIVQHGSWSAASIPAATRDRLVALQLVEFRCRHCRTVVQGEQVATAEVVATDRGRKYLDGWARAYGASAA